MNRQYQQLLTDGERKLPQGRAPTVADNLPCGRRNSWGLAMICLIVRI
jgi:hypothetical protein